MNILMLTCRCIPLSFRLLFNIYTDAKDLSIVSDQWLDEAFLEMAATIPYITANVITCLITFLSDSHY